MTQQPHLGRLIVFEGTDGVGKSTLSEQLTLRIRQKGIRCTCLAFPGIQQGTLGKLVYDVHHCPAKFGLGPINGTSLQVLHIAAHLEAIEGVILPALRAGIWVVLDRFWWSTWVYGTVAGVSESSLKAMIQLEQLHWEHVKPDILFLVERKDLSGDSDNSSRKLILNEYRNLATQEQHRAFVTTLHNDSSVEVAVDTAWQEIQHFTSQNNQEKRISKYAQSGLDLPLFEETGLDLPRVSHLSPARPTVVYDTFWRFAAERQEVFFRRLEGSVPPWTQDPILAQYKFTNAYRASDRVSQYLIRHVIQNGFQTTNEVFFRTLLFKFFNKIETWELLKSGVGEIEYASYSFETYDNLLTQARAKGRTIYSAAYIMPSAGRVFGYPQKHRSHLKLIERMMDDEVPHRIAESRSMHDAFKILRSYPSIGDFLAYQFVTDLNYSELTDFPETECVIPGPGALDGIHKCFAELGGLTESDLIRVVAERQEYEFERLGIQFRNLWGRRLQLIDCQNLFCEVSKYARLKHPDFKGIGGRSRIKQKFRPKAEPIDYFYPPKWGINNLIPQ